MWGALSGDVSSISSMFSSGLHPTLQYVFDSKFAKYMSQSDFYKIVQERGQLLKMKSGDTWLYEGDSVYKLAVLCEGKMFAGADTIIRSPEFVDSFELIASGMLHSDAPGVMGEPCSAVSIVAETECTLVCWEYSLLLELKRDSPGIYDKFVGAIGADVVNQLSKATCAEEGVTALQRLTERMSCANSSSSSAVEALSPRSGVSSNPEHGARLLQYFRNVSPDLPQNILHSIIKFGKFHEFRRKDTVFMRQGEDVCYVGIVVEGQFDLLHEDEITGELTKTSSIQEFGLVGAEDFMNKFRTGTHTVQVATGGAVAFAWHVSDLRRLMLADLEVETLITRIIGGHICDD